MDAARSGNIQRFVMGFDLQFGVGNGLSIEIRRIGMYGKLVEFDYQFGECVEVGAVGFEVDSSAGLQDLLIQTQEFGVRQPLFYFTPPKLRIGEGDPDVAYLAGIEIFCDPVDLGAQEGHIVELIAGGDLGPNPESVSFKVDPDEVAFGMEAGEAHGVFAFSTGQFEGNGMVVTEGIGPVSGHILGVLQYVRKCF